MKRTRILSLILALCMIFSLFSTPVLASDSSSSVSAQSSEDEEESKKAEEEKKKEEEEKKKAEEEKKKKEEEEKKKAEEEKKEKEEEEQKKAEEEKKKKEEEEKKKAEEEEQKKKEEEEKKKEESDKSDSSSDKSDKSDSSADKSDKSDSSADKSDKSDSSADKSDKSDSSADKSDKSDSSADKSSKSDSSADKSSKSDSSAEAESDASGSQSAEASSSQQAEGELSTQDGEQDVPQETPQVVEEQPEEQNQEEHKQEEEVKDNDTKVHAKLISDQADAQTLTAASFSDYSNSTGKAAGASVSFTRLITLEVTDLVPDNSSEGKKNISRIESVMSWINSLNDMAEYAGAMFKVIIPAGTYYIDGRYTSDSYRCIHLYTNTWLSMNGVTLIKSDTLSRAIIRAGKSKTSVSGYDGESNIILEGGVIDANIGIHKSKTEHFSGVRFGHDHDILIANVHFKGSVSGHHLELCGVNGISVVGCTFSDYKDTGYTKGINRNEAIQIDVTNSSNLTPTYAKYDDTVTGNVVVYKNQFVDLSRGVGSHSAVYGKYYDNVVIQGNSFMNIKSQAVHCENYRNCAIVDNIITNCGGGIDFNAICFAPDGNYYEPHGSLPKYKSVKTYNAKTVISGNSISVKKSSSLSNASGIYVHGGKATSSRVPKAYRKKTFRITGVSVDGNVITRSRSAGIYLACVDGYSVTNNQITKVISGSAARGMGIYLDSCGGGTLLGNTISGTKSHGIYLISSKGSVSAPITVHGNRVNATAKTGCIGVYLKSSRYVDLTSNTVNAKSYAVYLSKASNVNIGERNAANNLTSSSKYGIYATGKSKKGIYAKHNKITAKKKAVYAAKGSKIKSSNNATVVASSRKKSK